MNRTLAILFLVSTFFSCSPNDESIPEDVLSQEKFESVLLDAQLIEAHLNEVRVNQVFIRDSAQYYYNEIFQKQGVSPEQFDASIAYYTGKPEQLKLIYENVLESLSEMEANMEDVEIKKVVIVPLEKNILIEMIGDKKIGDLFLEDSLINQDHLRDSLFKYFILNDTILKRYNSNIESFEQSYHQQTHTLPLFMSLRDSVTTHRKRKLPKD